VTYLFSENGDQRKETIFRKGGFGGARVYFIYIFRLQIFVVIFKENLTFCCNGESRWGERGTLQLESREQGAGSGGRRCPCLQTT
jgi:hypothetical protein